MNHKRKGFTSKRWSSRDKSKRLRRAIKNSSVKRSSSKVHKIGYGCGLSPSSFGKDLNWLRDYDMTNRININKTTICTDSVQSEEMYGPWEEHNETNYNFIEKSETNSSDFTLDFTPDKGELLFLVYAVYSHGDSFGISTGNHEEIMVFRTKQEAAALLEELKKSQQTKVEKISFNGQTIFTYPWTDYFGGLDRFDVAVLSYIG